MTVQIQDIVVTGPLDEVVDALRARWHQLVPALVTLTPAETEAVRTPLRMALVALEEALLRLGVPVPGEAQDPQDDPLVLGVESGVGTDQRLDGWPEVIASWAVPRGH